MDSYINLTSTSLNGPVSEGVTSAKLNQDRDNDMNIRKSLNVDNNKYIDQNIHPGKTLEE
jgi:hypothetical protein